MTLTILCSSSYERKAIFPPSLATAGLIYSSRIATISAEIPSSLGLDSSMLFSRVIFCSEGSSLIIVFPATRYSRIKVLTYVKTSLHSTMSYFVTET